MVEQREIVGVSEEEHPAIREYLSGLAEKTKQVYERVAIPREEIDPRVLELEEELHKANGERARVNGLEYTRPQVLYLDRFVFYRAKKELEEVIDEMGILEAIGETLSSAGTLIHLPNTIVFLGKSFQDNEIDAYWTSFLLRHEMAHGGSVRKLQVSEPEPNTHVIWPYRTGAFVFSKTKGRVGGLITEGHNSIEDSLMSGELRERFVTWHAGRYLSKDETLEQRFPDGVRRYREIRDELKNQGKLPEGKVLIGYQIRDMAYRNEEAIAYADDYLEYRELMTEIYDRDPELYRMAEDLIYGDKFLPFARRLNQGFGEGFFSRLMRVDSPEEAREILEEIRKV